MALVLIDYLFKDAYSFPWEFIGMSRPMVGGVHSYLAEALSNYVDYEWRPFLKSRPTLSEIDRASKEYETFKAIVSYSKEVERDYGSVGNKVVAFLRRFDPLREDLQKIVDRKFREGLVNIPIEHLSYEGQKWLGKRGV